MGGIVSGLGGFYAKFPNLSSQVREIIAEILPWLVLLGGGALTIFAAIDLIKDPFVSILAGPSLAYLMLSAVTRLIAGVLLVSSFMPLRKRKEKGWMLLFLVQLLFLIGPILSFNLGTIIMNLILALIIFYFLYQVKPLFK